MKDNPTKLDVCFPRTKKPPKIIISVMLVLLVVVFCGFFFFFDSYSSSFCRSERTEVKGAISDARALTMSAYVQTMDDC
jgi:flagellar basal body-associated protein FliL